MSWKTNPIMEWYDTRTTVNGVANPNKNKWVKISDHGRSPLSISVERIENKQRMADGTLRRYVVSKKRTFDCSWENFPDRDGAFLANGQAGQWMEDFHNDQDSSFRMRLRSGEDQGKATTDASIEEVNVMIVDFSKEVVKRGPAFDLWTIDISLEEV